MAFQADILCRTDLAIAQKLPIWCYQRAQLCAEMVSGISMNPNFRNFALWAIIALLLIALFNMFQSPTDGASGTKIAYSQFLQDVDAGQINEVTISGNQIYGS